MSPRHPEFHPDEEEKVRENLEWSSFSENIPDPWEEQISDDPEIEGPVTNLTTQATEADSINTPEHALYLMNGLIQLCQQAITNQ